MRRIEDIRRDWNDLENGPVKLLHDLAANRRLWRDIPEMLDEIEDLRAKLTWCTSLANLAVHKINEAELESLRTHDNEVAIKDRLSILVTAARDYDGDPSSSDTGKLIDEIAADWDAAIRAMEAVVAGNFWIRADDMWACEVCGHPINKNTSKETHNPDNCEIAKLQAIVKRMKGNG